MIINNCIKNKFENLITENMRIKATKVLKAGGKLYLVGGCIRDILLNKEVHDIDFCVEGLTRDKFEVLFPEARLVGNTFPVYLINGHEYAFARKEIKVGNGYKGFDVDYNSDISIEEDLKRRDLTINAMAYDIYDKEFIDPYNGLDDLNKKILKPVSNAFSEDPLRAYRVARFSAQLGFNPVIETIRVMKQLKKDLFYLPAERVFQEFKKALNSNNPADFIEVLLQGDLLDVHFKEIYDLVKTPQVEKYHPEIFVYIHTLQSLKIASNLSGKDYLRFSILMHDIGKGLTPEDELPHHYQHHRTGVMALERFANRITIPDKWYKAANFTIRNHMKLYKWRELKPGTLVRLFKSINRSPLTIEDCIVIVQADRTARQKDWSCKELFDLDNFSSKITEMKDIDTLYYKLFNETGGKDIDAKQYSGKEFGEKLFQYRCQWIKKERDKLLN